MGFMCLAGVRWPLSLAGPAYAADAAAGAGPWLAEQVRGNVRIRAAGQAADGWQPLESTTLIAGNSEVATGADGIAVLANGIDRIQMSPNSHVVLPDPTENASLLTLIRQKLGRVFFDVGPRPQRRFEVEAPFLVVLVKGTQFTVQTNYIGNSVEVAEGTVEVRPADGGGPGTPVTAGETASIFAGSDTLSVGPSGSDGGSGSPGQEKGGAESRSGASQPRGGGSGPGGGGGDDGGDGEGGDNDGGDGDGGDGDGGGDNGGDNDGGGDDGGDNGGGGCGPGGRVDRDGRARESAG